MNQSVPVFRGQYLGASDVITSGPIQALGNKVVLSVTLTNVSGGACNFNLDGSYDGISWSPAIATAISPSSFGVYTTSKSTLDYAFVRVRADAVGKALFDATLAFSEQ